MIAYVNIVNTINFHVKSILIQHQYHSNRKWTAVIWVWIYAAICNKTMLLFLCVTITTYASTLQLLSVQQTGKIAHQSVHVHIWMAWFEISPITLKYAEVNDNTMQVQQICQFAWVKFLNMASTFDWWKCVVFGSCTMSCMLGQSACFTVIYHHHTIFFF